MFVNDDWLNKIAELCDWWLVE